MDKIFQRLIDSDFAELQGLTVDASIPVTESFANEIIASALLEHPQLEYCRLRIERENLIICDVKSPRWPWPFNVKLRLFGAMNFSGSPTLRAFLENHVLLGKLGSLFNAIPIGIRIYEDQLSVDVGALVNSRHQKALLDLVKAVEIRTEKGRIFFDLKIGK